MPGPAPSGRTGQGALHQFPTVSLLLQFNMFARKTCRHTQESARERAGFQADIAIICKKSKRWGRVAFPAKPSCMVCHTSDGGHTGDRGRTCDELPYRRWRAIPALQAWPCVEPVMNACLPAPIPAVCDKASHRGGWPLCQTAQRWQREGWGCAAMHAPMTRPHDTHYALRRRYSTKAYATPCALVADSRAVSCHWAGSGRSIQASPSGARSTSVSRTRPARGQASV